MVNCLIFLATLLLISFLAIIFYYKKIIDKKNIHLIDLYLGNKFLHKKLVDNLQSENPEAYAKILIKDIQEYYNLEDIIIIDSIKMLHDEKNTVHRKIIIEYVEKNLTDILAKLQDHQLRKLTVTKEGKTFILYITNLFLTDSSNGLIICLEKSPALLTESELISLENCINLIKLSILG